MTNHETEPVCKFEQGCHRVAPCDPGCAAPAAVSVPPPAPQAADRRERYAAAIAEGFRAFDADTTSDAYLDAELLDAVVAVADAEEAVTRADALAAAFREAAEALGRMDYDTDSSDYGYDTYRDAWNGGVMDGADLLRRLADESAVVPPPALTEEGRLRAQVEVLQQDAERDQGLAKVGARCMRDGHQGLIEQGRLVLEGWRFALSTGLGLGTGAPWEAIHERVKELTAAAAVSGPVAGEQQNETPEAEAPTATKPETAADRDTLRRQFGDVLRRWGLLDEQIDQKAAEEYAVTDLLALLPEQTSRDAEIEHLRDRLASCRERVGIAADKAIAAEDVVARARRARRRLTSALIAVEPLLTEPYPDDPRWTPWTRFVGPALKELSDALKTGPAANDEPPAAGVRQDGAQPQGWYRTAGFDQHDDYRTEAPE